MNQLICVAVGLCLSASAFAQDVRAVTVVETDACTGDVIVKGDRVASSKATARSYDLAIQSFELAVDALYDGEFVDSHGGPGDLFHGGCDHLKRAAGPTKGDLSLTVSLGELDEVQCIDQHPGGGRPSCTGGKPDNAASPRAVFIHNGYVQHDDNWFNGDNTEANNTAQP